MVNWTCLNRLSRLTKLSYITINFTHAVTCPSINNSPLPALVGSFVPINCPSGTTLTGPNVTVCTVNRRWQPDPRNGAACKGEPLKIFNL